MEHHFTTSGIICVDPNTKKFLVLQSRFNDKAWSFSKGFIEKNEQPLQSALRELYEETGISLSPTYLLEKAYVVKIKMKKPTRKIPSGVKIIKFWVAHIHLDTHIQLSREHSKFAWLSDFSEIYIHEEFTELSQKIKNECFD